MGPISLILCLLCLYGIIAFYKTGRIDLGWGVAIGTLAALLIVVGVSFDNAFEVMSVENLGLGAIEFTLGVIVVNLISITVLCCLKKSEKQQSNNSCDLNEW